MSTATMIQLTSAECATPHNKSALNGIMCDDAFDEKMVTCVEELYLN